MIYCQGLKMQMKDYIKELTVGCRSIELSAMMKIFYIFTIQYSHHWPRMAIEHLRCELINWLFNVTEIYIAICC